MQNRPSLNMDALKNFLGQVGSYTPDLIYSGGADTIFHYTDLGGLSGIVQNDDLWLTHSRFSNDDEELTYGYTLVAEVIEEQTNAVPTEHYKAYIATLTSMVRSPSPEGVYVCCFCDKLNLLSQWRGYAENGSGTCLGFKCSGFDYVCGPDSPSSGLVRLWRVFYDRIIQKQIIENAINHGYWSGTPESTVDQKAALAADAIDFFIPTFKHPDFDQEQEVRIIFTPSPDSGIHPEFRTSRGLLVPYYRLKDLTPVHHKLPISSLLIGPSVRGAINVESARLLLNKSGYTDVEVAKSTTPYRG